MVQTKNIKYGWAILATAFVILFFSSGSRMAFGVMLKPMQEDLGWSRTSLSLVATLFMVISSMSMPIAGRLADKYSFRIMLTIAVAMASIGVGLTGWVDMKWQLFLLYGVVFAAGNGASSLGIVIVLVSRWFPLNRGMANSCAIAGAAIGQLVIISLVASFFLDWGWRPSYKVIGLAIPILTLPMVLLFIRSEPAGKDKSRIDIVKNPLPSNSELGVKDASPAQYSYKSAVTSRQFLAMNCMFAICGFQDYLVGTHVVAFATDEGISAVLSGNLLAIMGIMGMVGVLIAGYMSDSFGPGKPVVMCFLLRVIIFALVVSSTSVPIVVIFALGYGFTFLMTAPLAPIFVARSFGTRNLGALSGTINMVHQMSGGLGAYIGGVVFDGFGDYHWAWVISLALSFVGASTMLAIDDRSHEQIEESIK